MFVPSFQNGSNDPIINSFEKYYMPLVENKVKNKQETYEKLIEMSRNADYTTGNLLDYMYHQSY